MNYEQFKDKAFAYAMRHGCTAVETVYRDGENFSVNALDGEIERYTVSKTSSLELRVQVGNKNGYAETEALEDVELLVDKAIDCAKTIETPDEHPMQGKCVYQSVQKPADPLGSMNEGQLIAMALELEKLCKAEDIRVKRVSHSGISHVISHICMDNTSGLHAEDEIKMGVCAASPVLEQNGESQNAYACRAGELAPNIEDCAHEAVSEAAQRFGASPVPTGKYRIILRADSAGGLLSSFFPMFSADMAQKGLSLLSDKIGSSIASELINIVDDPFYEYPEIFDGDGTPCFKKEVIKNGTLATLLHNLKTAKKAGVATTGNAGRSTPGSIVPTNFFITPGQNALQELLTSLDKGLLITELNGLHSGVNSVSGEFSLLASGMLVEGGSIIRPVDQITIAGTFISVMSSVQAVGSDLRFGIPGAGGIGSPSLLINGVTVSGK